MPQITYTIPDEKLEEFKKGFLKRNPVPIDDETGELLMTDNEWIKEWGRQQFLKAYGQGKRTLAEEQVSLGEDLIS